MTGGSRSPALGGLVWGFTRVLALGLLVPGLSACGGGDGDNPDAPGVTDDGGFVDAPPGTIDAPTVTIDAPAGPDADPTAPDFNPLLEVITWYRYNVGVDNVPYEGSRDQQNFQTWKTMQTKN